jgi:hypothetical protein
MTRRFICKQICRCRIGISDQCYLAGAVDAVATPSSRPLSAPACSTACCNARRHSFPCEEYLTTFGRVFCPHSIETEILRGTVRCYSQ